jgi:hypothetical protein
MKTTHTIRLFADYHQFYVWDAGTDPCAPEDYSDEDVARMVKVAENVVVVQPVRQMAVSVTVTLSEIDPGVVAADWDHIVECSLRLPTGHLQVHECTGGAVLDDYITPGDYRVRVLFGSLDSLSEDGLDGNDVYRVDLWPAPAIPLRVAKQWEGERAG